MKENSFTVPDGAQIAYALFPAYGTDPAQDARSCAGADRAPLGIVQIVHGAKERKECYYDFAASLAEHGFHVIVPNLRGHGSTLVHMDGWDPLVSDITAIATHLREHYHSVDCAPLPLSLFAHSFGSVLARLFLREHGNLIDRMILTGTVTPRTSSRIIAPLCRSVARTTGSGKPAGFPLHYGEPTSSDPVLAGVRYTNAAVATVWSAMAQLTRDAEAAPKQRAHREHASAAGSTDGIKSCGESTLPILFLNGAEDPVTGGAAGLQHSMDALHQAGYRDVRSITYPDAGHQRLHSSSQAQVLDDVVRFLCEAGE